jgi:hypothetical protein
MRRIGRLGVFAVTTLAMLSASGCSDGAVGDVLHGVAAAGLPNESKAEAKSLLERAGEWHDQLATSDLAKTFKAQAAKANQIIEDENNQAAACAVISFRVDTGRWPTTSFDFLNVGLDEVGPTSPTTTILALRADTVSLETQTQTAPNIPAAVTADSLGMACEAKDLYKQTAAPALRAPAPPAAP